jgi:hypothetical protein
MIEICFLEPDASFRDITAARLPEMEEDEDLID